MNLLVLSTDYPNDKGYIKLMYVHTRNMYYSDNGYNVTVINFAGTYDYMLNGINVITLDSFNASYRNFSQFDLLILHAANIRNHYKFLMTHNTHGIPKVFFYHGHEIMRLSETYPRPFPYMDNTNFLQKHLRNQYDNFKIFKWKKYFQRTKESKNLVFVSKYLENVFRTNINLDGEKQHRLNVINNSVGATWEQNNYDLNALKKYDFITIRSSFDSSTYAIDLIVKWAYENPNSRFLVIGKGDYFVHNNKPNNIELINRVLSHEELLMYVNESRIALMPTRQDTQGVMSCELATFGIPLITSDIEVTREIFSSFTNVILISNDSDGSELAKLLELLIYNYDESKNYKYSAKNTIEKELELFNKILKYNDKLL